MSKLKIITELDFTEEKIWEEYQGKDSSHDDKDGLPPIYSLGKARGFSKAVGMVKVNYQTHHRPWGYYEVLAEGPGYLVKRITVDPGKRTSLQWHEKRQERWTKVSGQGVVYIENDSDGKIVDYAMHVIDPGTWVIPVRRKHRIESAGTVPLVIIEVQTFDADNPSGEDDITRIEDDYNREVDV